MTALSAKKHDATGRSTGKRKTNKRNSIDLPFAPRPFEMLASPAYRTLSRAGHQLISRLEVEWGSHGGTENGRLLCTYDDLVAYGIHRHGIAPAIRECEALGLIEVTEHGRGGNAEFRAPNLFRLTYIHTDTAPPTHDWRTIKTESQAAVAAKTARECVSRPGRKLKSQ